MFDTHAIAQSLTRADLTSAQADAITAAVISAREQDDHVTGDQFKAGLAELRAEMAGLDTRLSGQIGDVRTEIAKLDTRLSTEVANVRATISNFETRLIKWTIGTVLATAGATLGIVRLLG